MSAKTPEDLAIKSRDIRFEGATYFAFYRPAFHPWRVNDRAFIRQYEPVPAR